MKKKAALICFIALFCILGVSASFAAPYVYVKNKAMDGKLTNNGILYVNAEEFLTKAGYSWQLNGTTLVISTQSGGGPKLEAKPTGFQFGDAKFETTAFIYKGKLYVQADGFSRKIGMASRYSQDTNTFDFFSVASLTDPHPAPVSSSTTKEDVADDASKAPAAPSTGGKDAPPAAPAGDKKGSKTAPAKEEKGKIVTIKEVEKSLIKPKVDFFSDWQTGEVRGTVYYTNSASKKIDQISVKFMIVDGYGKPLQTLTNSVGSLDPGAKSPKYDFFFLNPSQFTINDSSFKYEFTYQEPPKPKKKDDKKEDPKGGK
ncbi:MAG: hypothetical protein LWY06_13410 [Firmicutes bacterium]|nr:hypothetical protein [Bacillota bacterium]